MKGLRRFAALMCALMLRMLPTEVAFVLRTVSMAASGLVHEPGSAWGMSSVGSAGEKSCSSRPPEPAEGAASMRQTSPEKSPRVVRRR